MQQSSDLIDEVGQALPEGQAARVLAALRQEPLVWRSVEQADFRQGVMARGRMLNADDAAAGWEPARLALLALGEQRPVEALRAEPLAALGQALQERALQTYQNAQRAGKPPASLAEAGLLALALRERRRLTGTWAGMLPELLPKSAPAADADAAPAGAFAAWRAPLACLYGMVSDPVEMLRGLLPKNPQNIAYAWVAHILLCQPVGEAAQVEVLSALLTGLPVVAQLSLLRALSLRGCEQIAGSLAGKLLVGHPAFASLRAQAGAADLDLPALSARALALQQMGAFYQLAGDRAQALSLYNTAEITLEQWLAGLQVQRLDLQIDNPAADPALLMDHDQVTRLAAAADWLKNELGVVLVSHPCAGNVLAQIPGEVPGDFFQLKRARQMLESDPAVSRDLARQGAAGLLAEVRRRGIPFSSDFVYTWRPADALDLLLDLDLPEEALSLTEALLDILPADRDLLYRSGRILARLGKLEQAIQTARCLAALDPRSLPGRRLLADLWGQSGQWEQSLAEWQAALALSARPALSDRLACAQAAFQAGHPRLAVELGETILQEDANNGHALGLTGQALAALGETDRAVDALVRATMLAPDLLTPWLELARLQKALGEPQRALETLRAAVTALPEAAQTHLTLGEACVEAGLLAESLPHLKKACALFPDNGPAALLYGRTLRLLGHSNEARAALERVRSAWAASPELPYEYAQVLIDLKDAEAALPVLEMALRSGLPVVDASLLYARILLGDYRPTGEEWDAATTRARLQQARQAIENILCTDPDNLEAHFLLADILLEKGELEQALSAYRALAESPALAAPELRWRVQWGLGRAALRLGQADIAIAALKEACQERPGSLPLQRDLAEALLAANLRKEALEAAESTLQLASDDVETLAWYADFATRAGDPARAVEALERAAQIDPQRGDLLISLAGGQASAGTLDAARASLVAALALPGLNANELRRAAHVYLRLENPSAALACYERALAGGGAVPTSLLFEAAQLHESLGHAESALDLIQQAVQVGDDAPDRLALHLFQADLLDRLNRPQAAQAVLERALRIVEQMPAEEAAREDRLGEIYERFARLMVQSGDLPAALQHAEKALACRPGSAALCFRAAELALALLQNERAARIMAMFQPGEGESPANLLEQGRDGADLLCLQVEMALENVPFGPLAGRLAEAARWVAEALDYAPGDARLLAARAVLLARQGDPETAQQAFDQAHRAAPAQAAGWLAEAALELRCWKEALDLFARCAGERPAEARALLNYARALVHCAEQQRLCAAAGCRANAPGAECLGEAARQRFEEAIHAAGKLVSAGEVARWQARGQAVFAPSAQAARALAASPGVAQEYPEDMAALVAIMRQLNNRAAAIQVAQRSDHSKVLVELALCYLREPAAKNVAAENEGAAAAARAVAADPRQPLAHAILGMVTRQAGELYAALEEYENALRIWPGESGWHDAAGDLSAQMGDIQAGMHHRARALALEPANPVFASKLGMSSLEAEDISGAIGYLEQSCALDAEQPRVWLTLATAYHLAGRLPQALEAARKAGELNPASAEALLIAGETALAMNQSNQALELAQGAVRREPENAGAVLFLSSVLVLRGRVEDGLEVIEKAAPAVKGAFPVAFERAKLIHRLHGAKAALDVLEKLVKDHPEEPDLLGYLACTQAECGDVKSAERYAFRALRIDPNQPDLTLMLGRLQRQAGQLDQAVHLLGEAIRMAPENLAAYLELGSVYEDRREFNQALQIYRKAMQVAPGDYQAYYQSGLILRDSKDYSGAEAMLRRAADLAPENRFIRRQLVGVIALNLVHNKQEASVS